MPKAMHKLFNSRVYIANHVAAAQSRLTGQYANKASILSIVQAFSEQIQNLEDALYAMDAQRQLLPTGGGFILTTFGVGNNGFTAMQQSDIIAAMQTSIQATFGQNVNLGSASIFGQLIGIFSEREALLWQLAEAVYNSQYPGGAEGTSVDNILALNNLTRLPASATITDVNSSIQVNGIPLYGLVLYGTPGTVVPVNSIIQTSSNPVLSFTLDAAVTIAAAVNAQQFIAYSNVPNQGSYTLGFTGPSGSVLTTLPIQWNALPASTQLIWGTAPSSGSFRIAFGTFITSTISWNATAANIQLAIRSAGGPGTLAVVTGTIAGGIAIAWPGFCPLAYVSPVVVTFVATPTTGTYSLIFDETYTTSALAYNATSDQLQAAINALPGLGSVVVGGSYTAGFSINWNGDAPLTMDQSTDSTGQNLSFSYDDIDVVAAPVQAISAIISATQDTTGLYPFTDITINGSSSPYQIVFGNITPQSGQPSSGNQPQPIVSVMSNTLSRLISMVTTATNLSILQTVVGSVAQGIGAATCTVTGPNIVDAGQLDVIGSSLTGWTGVTNQLACTTGSNIETDTAALIRRDASLASQGNGPLQSIEEKVALVSGVTAVKGFQNLSNAALQTIAYTSQPPTGGGSTFSIELSTGTASGIAYNATALTVQNALQMLPGYGNVQVTGSYQYGYQIDFNGSFGGQAQVLETVASSGTSMVAAFGRSPHSYEIVVAGGAPAAIAAAILATAPAGIATYGSPAWQTTGTANAGSTLLTVASDTGNLIVPGQLIIGAGVAPGTTVASVIGTAVTMSLTANGDSSGAAYSFVNGAQVNDSQGNQVIVQFSEPVQVLIYVILNLVTDQYVTPGVSASGINPNSKFSPGSIPTIQQDIVNSINAVGIGGTVVGFGSNGIIGSFNSGIPGVYGYTLYFDTQPTPTTNSNVVLLAEQFAFSETNLVTVSYT